MRSVVLARHPIKVEQVIGHLKQRATQQLLLENLHPQSKFRGRDRAPPSPWARKSWPVFLKSDQEILRAIQYVQQNPLKDGKPRQRWDFVVPFSG